MPENNPPTNTQSFEDTVKFEVLRFFELTTTLKTAQAMKYAALAVVQINQAHRTEVERIEKQAALQARCAELERLQDIRPELRDWPMFKKRAQRLKEMRERL